ncbi:MAG: FtsX-like permease family protein [Acidimicrobiales bacterium]
MTGRALRLAVYRLRATVGRRRGAYLALVLLVGVVGGVAMGAIAGARRTQSSFPVYLASTNPSEVQFFTEFAPSTNIGYSARVNRAIARVRYVERSAVVVGFDGTLQPLRPLPMNAVPGEAPPSFEGGLNGEYLSIDRVKLLRGRMADPRRIDEFVMSASGAQEYGLHIGSTLPLGFFTDTQTASPTFTGYPGAKPYLAVDMKLVGIIEASQQVIQDDDAALGDQLAVVTPALTRRLATCCAYYSYVALQLDGGSRHLAAVASAVGKILPSTSLGPPGGGQTDGPTVAKAQRVARPVSIAFGAFGIIAALAALVIGGLVVSRITRRNAGDVAVLRALGAGPAMTAADGLVGILGAVVAGAVLAVVVAVALSPLAPVGAVRPVYPDPGIAFDWTVLAAGFGVLVVGLGAVAVLSVFRAAPQRAVARRGAAERDSSVARAAAAVGLPPAAVSGIRSALGAGAGRDAASVRSAVLGAVLAVLVIVTSVTFGASLNALVSRPALYGWNWDYAMLAGFSGAEDMPAAQTAALFDHDHDLAHWTGVYFEDVELDGQSAPALALDPNAAVQPALLSGHPLQSARQIVLGSATLAQLHKHLGDTVMVNTGGRASMALRIVGTATMPTIGGSGDPALQMGTGAVVSPSLFPPAELNQQGSPIPGPNAVFVTVRPGVAPAKALASLHRIDSALGHSALGEAPPSGVVSLLRPAEIADYRSVGSTAFVLAGLLGAGALGALGLTLVASVRRRRSELALLKALGFTERQLAATVVWQSSVSAAIGVIVGLPLGIALGRWLWTLFARGISAVPDPTVPVLSMVLVAVGALVFANLVAAVPGRIAARTPTAILLRGE